MIKSVLFSWRPGKAVEIEKGKLDFKPDIVMYFSDMSVLENHDVYGIIKEYFQKNTNIVGCSTSKPILMDDVFEGFVTGVALKFEKTKIKLASTECSDRTQSGTAAKKLAEELRCEDLCHVFVISDGMNVNGSVLMNIMSDCLGDNVGISGGMAADGVSFQKTYAGLNESPVEKRIVAIGFCGKKLKVGTAACGGWDPFGIDRIVTRSEGNLLYELDGNNALEIYKEYIGDLSKRLPVGALLYPLAIRKDRDSDERIIRTFDKIDEKTGTLRFSGDIPSGWYCQFMRGEIQHLAQGAAESAEIASKNIVSDEHTVAFAVSCLGRQIAMGEHVSDELEAVVSVLGEKVPIVGFYSHGEFCPLNGKKPVHHNQTMTLTVMREE